MVDGVEFELNLKLGYLSTSYVLLSSNDNRVGLLERRRTIQRGSSSEKVLCLYGFVRLWVYSFSLGPP